MLQRQESEARKAKAFTTEFNKQVTQHHGDIKGRIEATKKIMQVVQRLLVSIVLTKSVKQNVESSKIDCSQCLHP